MITTMRGVLEDIELEWFYKSLLYSAQARAKPAREFRPLATKPTNMFICVAYATYGQWN